MFPFGKKKPLVPVAVQEQVVQCIKIAEAKTTGEIRVFLESHCDYMDAMDRAREIFINLGMEKTECRNAVILYMAIKDKQFAIFGDSEIYSKAGGALFWKHAAEKLAENLRKGQLANGLCVCVTELGNALATHFPFDPAITKNELPDEIVFGK